MDRPWGLVSGSGAGLCGIAPTPCYRARRVQRVKESVAGVAPQGVNGGRVAGRSACYRAFWHLAPSLIFAPGVGCPLALILSVGGPWRRVDSAVAPSLTRT